MSEAISPQEATIRVIGDDIIGHQYYWRCTEAMRRECLLSVTLDAHNPKLNLSLEDATFIQSRIREVIQPEFGEWIEVEASPIDSERMVELPNTDWLGWVILASGSFLVLLFSMIVRMWPIDGWKT